jgi:hypothetical protein
LRQPDREFSRAFVTEEDAARYLLKQFGNNWNKAVVQMIDHRGSKRKRVRDDNNAMQQNKKSN